MKKHCPSKNWKVTPNDVMLNTVTPNDIILNTVNPTAVTSKLITLNCCHSKRCHSKCCHSKYCKVQANPGVFFYKHCTTNWCVEPDGAAATAPVRAAHCCAPRGLLSENCPAYHARVGTQKKRATVTYPSYRFVSFILSSSIISAVSLNSWGDQNQLEEGIPSRQLWTEDSKQTVWRKLWAVRYSCESRQ